MPDSTLTVSDHQYLRAFKLLFPSRLLRHAVAAHHRHTRDRKLPLHRLLGVLITWFFKPEDGLPTVVRWLFKAHQDPLADPSVYRARARLGWGPVRWLRQRVVRPLADPALDPNAFYHGRRLVGIDGTALTVADTEANRQTFGRAQNQHGASGYPLARVVALGELGTHALIDWVVRGYDRSENNLAQRLLRRVPQGSLLLADRNFHCYDLWHDAQHVGYDVLIRVQKGPKFPILKRWADGSYLSEVLPRRGPNKKQRALAVRVICYQWIDASGQVQDGRLVTSLLDAQTHPAKELLPLYHWRWELEGVFAEIKDQLAQRPMQLRAQDPERVLQEVEALLLGHYTVRWAMLQAAHQAKVPAVTLSFTGCVRMLHVRLAQFVERPRGGRRWWRWWTEVLQALGRQRLRPRRARCCPRARKATRSHWPAKKGQKEGTIPQLKVVPATANPDP